MALDVIPQTRKREGGWLEACGSADMGDTRSVAVAPHCVASPVGTIASAHFTASVPNFLAPEWHGMRVPRSTA